MMKKLACEDLEICDFFLISAEKRISNKENFI